MMNIIKFNLISILIVLGFIAKGQDIILKLNLSEKHILCSDISIQNAIVSFKDFSDGKVHEYPLNEISQISFNENQPNEICIPAMQIDTVKCKIDSITSNQLYFKVNSNQQQVINKEDVFCALFNGLGNESIEKYEKTFLQINAVQYSNKPKIVKRDGKQLDVRNLISLTADRAEFNIRINGSEIITYVDTKDISKYINKEPEGKRTIVPSSDYIMSVDGKYFETIVNHINGETIDYFVNSGLKATTKKVDKKELVGIFFADYSSQRVLSTANVVYNHKSGANKFKKIRFDFNAGCGYMLANPPKNYTEEQKKYINEMRLGFTMDMNLDVFLVKEFGIGLKYNQFFTSNSKQLGNSDVYYYEDNIKIRFFGLSLLGQIEFSNNRGSFYSGVSFGELTEVNRGKENSYSKKVEGKTFGVYLFMGADILIADNFSIGIKSGLMTGKIDQLKVNNENIEMPQKENLLRLDGLVNFKIYF